MLHFRNKNNWSQYFIELQIIITFYILNNPFRYSQAEYPLQLVYSTCHSAAAKKQCIIPVCIDMFLDYHLSFFICRRHQRSCNSSFSMSIAQKRHYFFLNALFNRLISPAACSPIRIDHFFFSKRRLEDMMMTNNILSELGEEI